MLKFHRICLALLVIVFLSATTSRTDASQLVNTIAEGVGIITSGDNAAARDQAIRDGLRIAVEKTVGAMVASETVAENYTVLRDRVYSNTKGYIKDYTIIDETVAGSLYRVTLEAQVARGDLKNDLTALGVPVQRKEMPRIMLMVAEQNVGMHYYTFWWGIQSGQANLATTESVLLKELTRKGFVAVDPAVKSGRVEIKAPFRVASLSNEDIVSIGKLYEADVIIHGKALATLAGSVVDSSMISATADVSLRAVNTDTGRVIAADANHAAAVHPSKTTAGTNALKAAAESISGSLLEQIGEHWNQDAGSRGLVLVEVAGIESYDSLVVFKEKVKQIHGVTGLYQRSYQSGAAVLDLNTATGTQVLADEIAAMEFGSFNIDVTGVSQNRIQLKIDGARK